MALETGFFDTDEKAEVNDSGLTDEQEEFLNMFSKSESEDDDEDDAEDDETNDESDEENDEVDDAAEENESDDDTDDEEDDDEPDVAAKSKNNKKANDTFAKMRITNKELSRANTQYKSAIAQFCKLFEIPDHLSEAEKIATLKDSLVKYESKKSNIPEDILRRLTQLEESNQSYAIKELDLYNKEAFADLQKEFNLDKDELEAFKQELLDKGEDWNKEKIMVASAYRDWHFDTIVEKKINARNETEDKRKNKIKDHASKPLQKKGKSKQPDEGVQIKTQAEFEKMLRGLEL